MHRASREVKQPINRILINLVGYISKKKPLPLLRGRRFVPFTTILLDLDPIVPLLIMVSIRGVETGIVVITPINLLNLKEQQFTSYHDSVVKVIS